ncbi:MAG: hypothetical protein MRERV_4c110 [Mycoplasmataceae bacterium RV_VA103A]|nr:MAG: hypothetical protein MRERV_4c110 [Mycoplasmataceae bacterium RV_VA103A]
MRKEFNKKQIKVAASTRGGSFIAANREVIQEIREIKSDVKEIKNLW